MDPTSRSFILKMKNYLSKRVDINKLKPFLEQHKIFTNAMLDDIYNYPSDYDFYLELTTRGPDAFCKFCDVLRKAGYLLEAQIFETDKHAPNQFTQNFRKQLCYKMNSKPFVGRCFIINNVKFEHLEERHGSNKDAEDLGNLFCKLGFEVKVVSDLKGEEIESYLEEFSKENWSNVDSCIVFILSHGSNMGNLDIVYGTDSCCVKKRDIYQLFDNVNCQPLKYKPKIFFFQACRGDDEDDGVESVESTDAAKIVKVPTMSNMLAVHSSLPNHISYRDLRDGTWFCQDLVETFSNDYLTQDLETMLKTVARKVESRVSVKQKKQVLSTEHFGFKAAVYFNMDNVADFCDIYDPTSS